jgi:NADH-quinone oxidoreductase subunit M
MFFGTTWRWLSSLFLAVAMVALVSTVARAEDARRGGTVRLTSTSGERGPIQLVADREGFSADMLISNDGKEPLVVSRIAVRGDAADPRVPPKLSARIADGSLPITIAPGASRKANVSWSPEQTKARQLFGHVVVTTSDEQSGEVAMGVRAQVPGILGPLEGHLLSLLIGLPILGAIGTFLARGAANRGRTALSMAAIALAAQVVVAGYIYRGFVPDIARPDGNDGLQFIEHTVWIRALSAELYLAVDGIGATALFVTSLVVFLAVVFEQDAPRGATGYHAALLVLDAALVGAIVAMDGLLFVLFSAVAVLASGLLVGGWGGDNRRSAALRLAVSGSIAASVLAVALVSASRHSDPTFLVDGTRVTTTFSLPELSRVAFGAKEATLFGGALVKVCFAMVLGASLFLLGAFPMHRWLADLLATAPSAAGVIVCAALPTLGLCAFLRIGCAVFPEGMRWASGVVVALGAISAGYGALSALGQTDLRRLAACATMTQVGFILLGAGSLTPQGLSGAIVLGATRPLACGACLLLASAIDERTQTTDAARLGGMASRMPGWGTALAIVALAQAGVLGLGGAWGPILALIGALSSYAPLAISAGIALVIIAAAHLSVLSRIAFGPLDPEWGEAAGSFPDLTRREWTSVAPLVLLVVLLGLWPAPIVSVTTGTVRDLDNAVSPPGPDKVALR